MCHSRCCGRGGRLLNKNTEDFVNHFEWAEPLNPPADSCAHARLLQSTSLYASRGDASLIIRRRVDSLPFLIYRKLTSGGNSLSTFTQELHNVEVPVLYEYFHFLLLYTLLHCRGKYCTFYFDTFIQQP